MVGRIRWWWKTSVTFVADALAVSSLAWNRFWFTPTDPSTLCLIRILAGAMLFYTHLIWTLDLAAFFGEQSWLTESVISQATSFADSWSVLSWCRGPWSLWTLHLFALATFALLTVGLWTRFAAVVAFVFTVSYAHRAPGALFGLDQINSLLSLYLIVGPSGSRYSCDAWRACRAGRAVAGLSVTANMAIRLIQCHLCVIYAVAGLSKLQSVAWWNGSAVWGAIANQEYQTLDVTWLATWPLVVSALTHAVVAFEVSYSVLIWNRWTRPLVLFAATCLHLGIVFVLGMPTFGLAMLIANLAFVSPGFVRALISGPQFLTPCAAPKTRTEALSEPSPSLPHFASRNERHSKLLAGRTDRT
jgi:hypothetical protein